jgi:hypothetical protein
MAVAIVLTSPPAQHFQFDAFLSAGGHDATPGDACSAIPVASATHAGNESLMLQWPYVFGEYYNRTIVVHVYPSELTDAGTAEAGSSDADASVCYANTNWTLQFQGN